MPDSIRGDLDAEETVRVLANPKEKWRVFVADQAGGTMPVPLSPGWVEASNRSADWSEGSVVFILDPLGRFDHQLNEYLSGIDTVHLALSSKVDYAHDIARFCTFLWNARRPLRQRTWRDATALDRAAFLRYRMKISSGPRVRSSTWRREVTAVAGLYRTAARENWIGQDPILRREARGNRHPFRSPQSASVPREIQPGSTQRHTDWIPPGDYRQWREVGVRGFSGDLLPRDAHRGRQSSRDRCFTDLMVTTGMRLEEQSVLLKAEVPGRRNAYSRMLLPASITKNSVSRLIWIPASVLLAIDGYIRIDRKLAVAAGRRAGIYSRDPSRLVLPKADSRSAIGVLGDRHKIDDLSPEQRMHLYAASPDGLEPAALWLTEAGKPMQSSSWQSVFRSANKRCATAGYPDLRVHPHMLRHTFATVLLHQLERLYLTQAAGRRATDPSLAALHLGDPLKWVKVRLGHASIETTERYCHPLQELESDTLMALIPDIWGELAVPQREELALSGEAV